MLLTTSNTTAAAHGTQPKAPSKGPAPHQARRDLGAISVQSRREITVGFVGDSRAVLGRSGLGGGGREREVTLTLALALTRTLSLTLTRSAKRSNKFSSGFNPDHYL